MNYTINQSDLDQQVDKMAEQIAMLKMPVLHKSLSMARGMDLNSVALLVGVAVEFGAIKNPRVKRAFKHWFSYLEGKNSKGYEAALATLV